MSKKFEYNFILGGPDICSFRDTCDMLGQRGWEVVSCGYTGDKAQSIFAFFKREIIPEPTAADLPGYGWYR